MKLIYSIVIVLALASCGRGPAGEKGPAGAAGATGPAGADGVNAAMSAYSVVEVVDVCGDAPGIIDEVLLKLANGQILASFSDTSSGKNTRFAIVPAGQYVATDGSGCVFSISASGQIAY